MLDKSPLRSAVDPLNDAARWFLNTIRPTGNETLFGIAKEAADEFKKTDVSKAMSTLFDDYFRKNANHLAGYSVCVILGCVMVLMPLVSAFFYCCFVMCCKGEPNPRDKRRDPCRRAVYGFFTLCFAVLIIIGGLTALFNVEVLVHQFRNTTEKNVFTEVQRNTHEVPQFLRSVKESLKNDSSNAVASAVAKVEENIGSTSHSIGIDIENKLQLDNTMSTIKSIKDNMTEFRDAALSITNSKNNYESVIKALQAALNEYNTNRQKLTCAGTAPKCTKLKTTATEPTVDPTKIQWAEISGIDINTAISRIENVEVELGKINIEQSIQDNLKKMKKIDEAKINKELLSSIEDKISTIDKEISNIVRQVDGRIDSLKQKDSIFQDVLGYVRIGSGVMCGLLLLIGALYLLTLLFGCFGDPPFEDASCCNRAVGARMISANCCLTLIFGWFITFITMGIFLAGGLAHTEFCRYVTEKQNETYAKNVEMLMYDLRSLTNADTKRMLKGVLIHCKNNASTTDAFNVDTESAQEAALKTIETKIKDARDEIENMDVLSGLDSQLTENLKDEIKNLEMMNGLTFAQSLVVAKKSVMEPPNKDVLTLINEATTETAADKIDQATLSKMKSKLDTYQPAAGVQIEMKKSLQVMEKGLPVEEVKVLVQRLETNMDKTALKSIVTKNLDLFEKETVAWITNVVGKVLASALGCDQLFKSINAIILIGCSDVIFALNGIWLGLGCATLFSFIALACCCMLRPLYKKSAPHQLRYIHDAYAGDRNEHIPMSGLQNGAKNRVGPRDSM